MRQEIPSLNGSIAEKFVLVVDDDCFSREFFVEILEELQVAEIQSESNGSAALKTLAGLPRTPDLLICDVFMPDMDGIEFLGKLSKSRYPGSIILVSGQDVSLLSIAQQIALADGLKLIGAYPKPVPIAVLADVLTRI